MEGSARGRCAGCEKTGPARQIRRHVTECAPWLALPPDCQLTPEAEYRRWQDDDRDAERDQHRRDAIVSTTAARAAVAGRFARSRDLDSELDDWEATG